MKHWFWVTATANPYTTDGSMIYPIRFKTIKMPGCMTCPITGKLVRNNRLVEDTPRSLEENRAIIDDKLGLV